MVFNAQQGCFVQKSFFSCIFSTLYFKERSNPGNCELRRALTVLRLEDLQAPLVHSLTCLLLKENTELANKIYHYRFVGHCGALYGLKCTSCCFRTELVKKIFFRLFCSLSFFSVFIFSVPSKVIIIAIQLMFLGINIFWVLLVAHFDPRPTARVKMGPSRAQSIVMPANINKLLFY